MKVSSRPFSMAAGIDKLSWSADADQQVILSPTGNFSVNRGGYATSGSFRTAFRDFIVMYCHVSIRGQSNGGLMRVKIMPGRKTILFFKGQGKMRRIGITYLRCHNFYRHFIIQQLSGMLQLILLVVSEQGLAVIFLELCLKACRAHG